MPPRQHDRCDIHAKLAVDERRPASSVASDTPAPVAVLNDWRRLAAAFCDDTTGVQWYLHMPTGSVVRVVEDDGASSITAGAGYIAIQPARSKKQFVWMERFIYGLDDPTLAAQLSRAIVGKHPFPRFKAELGRHPGRTAQWYSFRNEQLWAHIRHWLHANDVRVVVPPDEYPPLSWRELGPEPAPPARSRVAQLDAALSDLEEEDLEALSMLATFLRDFREDAGTGLEPE